MIFPIFLVECETIKPCFIQFERNPQPFFKRLAEATFFAGRQKKSTLKRQHGSCMLECPLRWLKRSSKPFSKELTCAIVV